MKISKIIIAIVAINLFACQFLFAQNRFSDDKEKLITEKEFFALKNKAEDKLKSGNYRTKTIVEIYNGSATSPYETTVEIYESLKTDRMRVTKESTIDGRRLPKTGFMMIGNDRYSLDKNGSWNLNPRSGYGGGTGSGSGRIEVTPIYKFLGKSKLDGKTALVYEVIEKKTDSLDNKLAETNESRYFFSTDGKLLRVEETKEDLKLNLKVKRTIINEYNALVVIQTPSNL